LTIQKDEIKELKKEAAEYDEILAVKDGDIKILRRTAAEVEYWKNLHGEQQRKFLALYSHTCDMADDRDAMIEEAKKKKVEIKQQELLIKQLKNRVASLVHEDNLEHLAKQQSITTYSSPENTSVTSSRDSRELDTASVCSNRDSKDKNQSELDIASVSSNKYSSRAELAMNARRQEESQGISRMLDTVDRLARHYSPPDRYHESTMTNLSPPRLVTDPERLPDCVPQEMFAIWLHAHQEDLTPEEVEGFAKYLTLQIRPPPIHSPHLKKPFVNWTKVNPFQYKNLPQPSPFPIQGCSPDPEFYKKTETLNDSYYTKVVKWGRDNNKCPFGILYGFSTNMGTVPVPAQVIHGYRCNPTYGTWQLDAKG